MKNLLKIYDLFKCKNNNTNIKQAESLSDISKVTKKVITNKKKYRNYFIQYNKKTEVYSFKSPGISKYPLLQKKSSALLPITRTKMNFYEDLKENQKNTENKKESSLFSKSNFFIQSANDSFYKNKIRHNLKISKYLFRSKFLNFEKENIEKKNIQRYNSLFADFFYKWNKDKLEQFINRDEDNKMGNDYSSDLSRINKDNYKYIKNDKYSELKYNENIIFGDDYNYFVSEKLDFVLANEIENRENKLESIFNDYNQNEIKLRLESIKIIFKPIRSKISALDNLNTKENNFKKQTILYIPLYFVFIFCMKNTDFFKYILLSCITFSENGNISLNENLIRPALKAYFNLKKKENYDSPKINRNSGVINTISKKVNKNIKRTATKGGFNFRKSSIEKKGAKVGKNNSPSKIFNTARNSILEDSTLLKQKQKKEEIYHSNQPNKNYFYNQFHIKNENEEQNKTKINHFNEYVFIWETNDKTYLVNIHMPIIYFNYKNLKDEIAVYCDKALFLFLYKHHFQNWDFYSLNYLFSLKAFRKVILQNYSLTKKYILNLFKNDNTNNKNNLLQYLNKGSKRINSSQKNININSNEEKTILNKDKNKIFNVINDNNESYIFFYTNESYQNTLVKLYSYVITIDYDKLNPKVRWKYILDFKLMKKLNEINKYQPLDTFLPKITKTDFQNGFLSIDFSLCNEFNIDILGYEKKILINNIMDEDNNMKKINQRNKIGSIVPSATNNNDELCINIKFPSLKEERAIKEKDDKIIIKKINLDLDINFLQSLNKYKMDFWSKKILEEIIKKNESSFDSDTNKFQNISDKKNYINKVNTFNASSFGSKSDNTFKNKKKFMRGTSYNYSQLISKFHT